MASETNTGGLKSFEHSTKVNYSSKEEEERYAKLGEEAFRISKEKKKRKQMMKWLTAMGIAAIVFGVIIVINVIK